MVLCGPERLLEGCRNDLTYWQPYHLKDEKIVLNDLHSLEFTY